MRENAQHPQRSPSHRRRGYLSLTTHASTHASTPTSHPLVPGSNPAPLPVNGRLPSSEAAEGAGGWGSPASEGTQRRGAAYCAPTSLLVTCYLLLVTCYSERQAKPLAGTAQASNVRQ